MDNDKNRRLVLGILLVAIIFATVGTTLAFFITQAGRNEEQKLTIKTGNLALTFEDNDDGLNERIMIGESVEKLFIIRNTGTQPVTTNMIWDGLVNTYLEESLSYALEYKTSEAGTYQTLETAHENVPQSDRADDYNLAKDITIPAGSTYYYKLTITFNNLTDINQEADRTAILSTKFNLGEKAVELVQIYNGLRANPEEITDYKKGNTKEMYTFKHPKTSQTEAITAYRYIGFNPNNYINFNDESWRIIGVFTLDDNKEHLKLIRDLTLEESTLGKGNWSMSTLKTNLNEKYFNMNDKYSDTGLNENARNKIYHATWYLGSRWSAQNVGATLAYSTERGSTPGDDSTTLNVTDHIGLIYPSDFLYTYAYGVDSKCFSNGNQCYQNGGAAPEKGWLYNQENQWTITPDNQDSRRSWVITNSGLIHQTGYESSKYGVRPTLYLNANCAIVSGDGSINDPYVLAD